VEPRRDLFQVEKIARLFIENMLDDRRVSRSPAFSPLLGRIEASARPVLLICQRPVILAAWAALCSDPQSFAFIRGKIAVSCPICV